MRSRTSLCNRADLRVDFTRFAPLWVLYTVLLAAIIMMCLPQSKTAYDTASVLSGLAGLMAPIQFCYALLTAQCLFGYLYDTRLCYTIHAMPRPLPLYCVRAPFSSCENSSKMCSTKSSLMPAPVSVTR